MATTEKLWTDTFSNLLELQERTHKESAKRPRKPRSDKGRKRKPYGSRAMRNLSAQHAQEIWEEMQALPIKRTRRGRPKKAK